MKLSIVTICYNDRAGLLITLQSVSDSLLASQTYTEVEHIIVDGLSTDGSQKIIDQYCGRATYATKWVSELDGGIYDAMNKGSHLATGEFIQFLNAGDNLIPNNFEKVLNSLYEIDKNTDVICFGYTMSVEHQNHKTFFPLRKVNATFLRMPTSHQAMFYRKSIFDDIEYDTNFQISGDFNHLCQLVKAKKNFESRKILAINFAIGGISSTLKKTLFAESALSILRYNSFMLIPVRLIILAIRIFP
jgi:glycosyltransferase involved in cell wall biosynthesis